MNLRELSRVLGLSQTTVSRALNGYPEVSETTRNRVADAAREHNYRPNIRAKSLATGRAMAIAHVIPVSSQHEVVNPVFADFIAGAGETYARHGYDMMLSLVGGRQEAQLYRELSARRGVDGLIVHAPRLEDDRRALLDGIGLPYLVHGRFGGSNDGYNWLDVDNRAAFRRGTAHLIDLGHRRIALINGLETMDFAARRRAGYGDALTACDIAVDPVLCVSGEMTEYNGYDAARALLALPDPPTAIIASSMITTIGVRRACHERGLVLGHDISVVAHDDDLSYFGNGQETPEFTGLLSPVRDHGRRAAEMLLQVVGDPARFPLTQLLEAELRVGRSSGQAPVSLRGVKQG